MVKPALAALALLAAGAAPLAAYRGEKRVLVVSAPSAQDADLARQRALLAAAREGAAERDLVTLEALGDAPPARALRAAAGLPDAGFAVALIGKDGGVKFRAQRPVEAAALFAIIDAMPMRRQEKRERGR